MGSKTKCMILSSLIVDSWLLLPSQLTHKAYLLLSYSSKQTFIPRIKPKGLPPLWRKARGVNPGGRSTAYGFSAWLHPRVGTHPARIWHARKGRAKVILLAPGGRIFTKGLAHSSIQPPGQPNSEDADANYLQCKEPPSGPEARVPWLASPLPQETCRDASHDRKLAGRARHQEGREDGLWGWPQQATTFTFALRQQRMGWVPPSLPSHPLWTPPSYSLLSLEFH